MGQRKVVDLVQSERGRLGSRTHRFTESDFGPSLGTEDVPLGSLESTRNPNIRGLVEFPTFFGEARPQNQRHFFRMKMFLTCGSTKTSSRKDCHAGVCPNRETLAGTE